MGIMYDLYSYTFLAFKDYLNRRRAGKKVYRDVMEGRMAPTGYTHPDVAHLNANSVEEIARMIREDLPKIKPGDCVTYRAMDGSMIYLRKDGNVDVFNASDVPVARFYTVNFFEKYYNDDPRQIIDDMLFDGNVKPKANTFYELEDGNSLLYNPSEEAKIDVVLPKDGGVCCSFLNLEHFFEYYKLHETKNMAKKYCTSCGAQLPMDAVFCGKCGSKQQ